MTTHALKIWPEYFRAALEHRKAFEVRRADRDYRVGDLVQLCEWIPPAGGYTGRVLVQRILYVGDLEPIGIPGFVGLGLGDP